MKKIDIGTQFVTEHLNLFRCPTCHEAYVQVVGHGLICPNQHELDLSKKGTLHFLKRAIESEYDDAMFAARRHLVQAGLFDGITDALRQQLADQPETILDVGCGEGTPLARLLAAREPNDVAIGFDISKPGINLATQLATSAFFCVADLTDLPFNNQTFTTIVDLFSPSAYNEFDRILAPGGQLLKVVPNGRYLHELRELLYSADSEHRTYTNEEVVSRYLARNPDSTATPIHYEFPIPNGMLPELLLMTPLHWGADRATYEDAQQASLDHVTVDVTLLRTKRSA